MPKYEGPTYSLYMGIDPGKSGGIATVAARGKLQGLYKMPSSDRELWELLESYRDWIAEAALELVSGYIGREQPGSAMFTFGVSYGALRMGLVAASIPFVTVAPRTWQKALGVTPRARGEKGPVVLTRGKRKGQTVVKETGGETKDKFKKRLFELAKSMFPHDDVTRETADALLIAEYLRRMAVGY